MLRVIIIHHHLLLLICWNIFTVVESVVC